MQMLTFSSYLKPQLKPHRDISMIVDNVGNVSFEIAVSQAEALEPLNFLYSHYYSVCVYDVEM